MPRHFALFFIGFSSLTLQACWVPQVIQGVRPQLIQAEAQPPSQLASVSLNSKLTALATRLVTYSKQTSQLFQVSASLAAHRQALENHTYYNVKNITAFSGWQYYQGMYTAYDTASGSRYQLAMQNSKNSSPDFDVLGFGSYGEAPLPAKKFPVDVMSYTLSSQQSDLASNDTLKLNLTGHWPVQIPLRDSFVSTLSGTATGNGHPAFKNFEMNIIGKSLSDGSSIDAQLSFSSDVEGTNYKGFGTIDAKGFVGSVNLEQNGRVVATIVRRDPGWDVEINGKVVASAN